MGLVKNFFRATPQTPNCHSPGYSSDLCCAICYILRAIAGLELEYSINLLNLTNDMVVIP